MKNKLIYLILILFVVSFFQISCEPEDIDNTPNEYDSTNADPEVKIALDYLNKIRQNPSAYSTELGVDLSYVNAKTALNWNNSLAKAAQDKAEYMAKNNYFGHVDKEGNGMNIMIHNAGYTLRADWINDKSLNYFESIGAGYTDGLAVIKALIVDKNTPSLGHRNHLLGISDFWANCYDIGIGYSYSENSTYGHYWSILIAKHDF